MSRPYHPLTKTILDKLSGLKEAPYFEIFKACGKEQDYKFFYNAMYRLEKEGLIKKNKTDGKLVAEITPDGKQLLQRLAPQKDGVWKMVIFDIPEKHKYVRNVLRAKLKALHFKKWQNSIWITPYILDEEIEKEMKELAGKFFVRLIKTTEINQTEDLEKMFENSNE
jgi:DNA-binding transcriptional regulator PaaX